jgi:hypothetical protein
MKKDRKGNLSCAAELRILAVQKQTQEAALILFQRPSRHSLSMLSFVSSNLALLDVQERAAQMQKKLAERQSAARFFFDTFVVYKR